MYRILQHNTSTFGMENCSVILVAYAITEDTEKNKVFLQCKFENLDVRAIKAVYIKVSCTDILNQVVDGVEKFSYLDLCVVQYQTFADKVPVYLPDRETRNITVTITKIVFVDGSVWDNSLLVPLESFDQNKVLISQLGILTEEYRRQLHSICGESDKHKYLPVHVNKYVRCGCGKIILDKERKCPACGVEIARLFELSNVDKLKQGLKEYQEIQAAREAEQRSMDEKKHQEYQAFKRNTIRISKRIGIIAGSVALVAVIAIVTSKVIVPNVRYNNAMNAIKEANYESAVSTLERLDEFKDAKTQLKAAQYAWAESKLKDGDLEGAIQLFKVLGEYGDASSRVQELNNKKTYEQATVEFQNKNYIRAKELFESLGNYSDSAMKVQQCEEVLGEEHYTRAVQALENHDTQTALKEFLLAVPYKDSIVQARSIGKFNEYIKAGYSKVVWLKPDGTLDVVGSDEEMEDVLNWKNIKSISVNGPIAALTTDGKILSTDKWVNIWTKEWNDISEIYLAPPTLISTMHIVGLKENGKVVANGWSGTIPSGGEVNYNDGGGEKCKVDNWSDIKEVSVSTSRTVGLKKDGTVCAAGYADDEACRVQNWNNIVKVATGAYHTVGLCSDGTVIAVGEDGSEACDVSEWSDIVDIAVSKFHTLGLKKDGTVVAVGDNEYHQCDVEKWENIVAIWTNEEYSLGLQANGEFVFAGNNEYGQCDIPWKLW